MSEVLKQNFSWTKESNLELKDFYSIEVEVRWLLRNFWVNDYEVEPIIDSLDNFLKDKKIIKVSWTEPCISFKVYNEINGKKENIIYNVESWLFLDDIDIKLREAQKKLEKWQVLLSAMEEIFTQNSKEYFWELNDEDTLKTDIFDKHGFKLKWKNLRQIQVLLSENIQELLIIQSAFTDKQKKDFFRQQKKYMEFVMWVWDKYEWASLYLKESLSNFKSIAENLIYNLPIDEVFIYMVEIHQKIDNNNYQSQKVQESYKLLNNYLCNSLLNRLKSDPDTPDEYFVNFSKIITWRWDYKNGSFSSADIDDDLRRPELAADALAYVFTRKWWMFEKMNIKNLDKNLSNKRVWDELDEFNKLLWDTWAKFDWEKIPWDFFIINFWYSELLDLKDKKYEELNLEAQSKLSVINKLNKKLKAKTLAWKKVDYENPNSKNWFWTMYNEMMQEFSKDLESSIEKLFGSSNPFSRAYWVWKSAEDFWFVWVQKEAYDLFVDMNWIWLLDISDKWEAFSKWVAKFWAMLAVSLGVSVLTWWLWFIASWAIVWAAWTITYWWLNPTWYDTPWEMASELSTSLAMWTALWAVWWAYLPKVWIKSWTLTRRAKKIWAWIFDMSLWFGAELTRWKAMDHFFHSQQKLIEVPPEVSLKDIYANPEKYKNPE